MLGATALAQTLIFTLSGGVALLADLIHNFGDALTAVPLAIAFLLRSQRAERIAGLFVVAAIFVSACVAGVEAISRLVHPQAPTHLAALAAAGAIGYLGNLIAAQVRTRAGRRLDSPVLIADGNHCARRRLRVTRRHRLRGRRGRWPAGRRRANRPRDHARDPAHHLAVMDGGARTRTRALKARVPPPRNCRFGRAEASRRSCCAGLSDMPSPAAGSADIDRPAGRF